MKDMYLSGELGDLTAYCRLITEVTWWHLVYLTSLAPDEEKTAPVVRLCKNRVVLYRLIGSKRAVMQARTPFLLFLIWWLGA